MSEPIQVEFLKSSINSLDIRSAILMIATTIFGIYSLNLPRTQSMQLTILEKAEALTSKLTAKNVMSPLETQAVAFLLIGFRSCSTCFLPENLMTLRPSAKRVWD